KKKKKVPAGEKRVLRAKLAETYAGPLGLLDDAVAMYKGLLEDDASDESAIDALDRLLRRADRPDDLRWRFDLRVANADGSVEEKLERLTEWAVLEEEAWSSPGNAIALYRRILEISPQHGAALRALSRLLQGAGDAEGAASALALERDQRQG